MLGFIGLGAMGEPMCKNLALNGKEKVIAYDLKSPPLARLKKDGVRKAKSFEELSMEADIIFLSLPSGEQVNEVCLGRTGLINFLGPKQCVVDCSTSPPELARKIQKRFMKMQVDFADAPVSRTRSAAIKGTLSITVGAQEKIFAKIKPFLSCMATDITHCGDVGAGQTVKILNNMLLFQNCLGISQALAVAKKSGLDEKIFLDAIAKGSGDSFALRNHAMNSMLTRNYPEGIFSVHYALKDLKYAMELADLYDIDTTSLKIIHKLFDKIIDLGLGERYHPIIRETIES